MKITDLIPEAISLDSEYYLYFDLETKGFYEWCRFYEKATPISRKKALKKYKMRLNPDGERLFQVDSRKIALRRIFLLKTLSYTSLSVSCVWFLAFSAFAITSLDPDITFLHRLLSVIISVLPGSFTTSLFFYLDYAE